MRHRALDVYTASDRAGVCGLRQKRDTESQTLNHPGVDPVTWRGRGRRKAEPTERQMKLKEAQAERTEPQERRTRVQGTEVRCEREPRRRRDGAAPRNGRNTVWSMI